MDFSLQYDYVSQLERRGKSNTHADSNINRSNSQYDACSLCRGIAHVFDIENGEVICSKCGMVIHDSIEAHAID
jgi:ribosomal protein S27E